jgi:hypothetical protein
MAQYQVLFWYDIPLQVRAGSRKDRFSKELSSRFQVAIDRAAVEAELTGTDEYLEGFHWGESQERPGTPEEVTETIVAELESSYKVVDWQKTADTLRGQS